MKKYKAHWYNLEQVVYTEPEIIEASNEEEAERIAYIRHDGNPPANTKLYLEEVH